jgi:hypothetical protein
MLVKIVAKIITEVSVLPEDILNADTVGDYKAELANRFQTIFLKKIINFYLEFSKFLI